MTPEEEMEPSSCALEDAMREVEALQSENARLREFVISRMGKRDGIYDAEARDFIESLNNKPESGG